jgi:hypothetical protein
MPQITVPVTPEERSFLLRPVRGATGGFQGLLKRLQGGLSGAQVTLSVEDGRRLVRYAENYKDGGWQARLRPLVAQVKAALPPLASHPTFDLFGDPDAPDSDP